MEHTSILDRQTLSILKSLEYYFDVKKNEENTHEITFGDLNFKEIKSLAELYPVAERLQENGINFSIDFDLVNDTPLEYELSGKALTEQSVVIGRIKGKKVAIKDKISKVINKLSGQVSDTNIKIVLNTTNGTLEVGDCGVSLRTGTMERTMVEILVRENQEISWDIIKNEHIGIEDEYPSGNRDKDDEAKKELSDTQRRLNQKINNETSLKNKLIRQKKNTYSLTRKVTKK